MSNALSWVRASKYCDESGEPIETVHERIRTGEWAAGLHYKRTGPRTLWINTKAVDEWVEKQPHVESTPFPRVSKSVKVSAVASSV